MELFFAAKSVHCMQIGYCFKVQCALCSARQLSVFQVRNNVIEAHVRGCTQESNCGSFPCLFTPERSIGVYRSIPRNFADLQYRRVIILMQGWKSEWLGEGGDKEFVGVFVFRGRSKA